MELLFDLLRNRFRNSSILNIIKIHQEGAYLIVVIVEHEIVVIVEHV